MQKFRRVSCGRSMIKQFIFALFVMVSVQTIAAPAYPDRPLSVLVAYSPGGATDFQARIVTMMAAEKDYLGQPMVILNKPGAGGQVGWNWFAEKGSRDGYTLSAYNIPHFIAQSIMSKTKYNIRNLEPIANWGADPAVLIVRKDSQFKSVSDLIKYAKANPGKVTVSGAGRFVGHHIAMLQLEQAAGIKLTYVPTKGGVDAMRYVLGGQVMIGFNNLSDAYRSRERLKILAVADLKRNKEFLPDVPTFKEQGVNIDDSSVNFRGLMVPKGTPKQVIALLAKRVPKLFRDAKAMKKMKQGGSPMRVLSREQVKRMWTERERYLKVLLEKLKSKTVSN